MRIPALCLLAAVLLCPPCRAQNVPVFEITPVQSTITFDVKASVAIKGTFDKWNEIQAASVDTGSGMKNKKLKSDDFFDVEKNPLITFKSTKVTQTGPTTFDVDGTFTIRGVSKPETLKLVITGKGTGSGTIQGNMAFDRKQYGMNSGIPFIKIADRVEVDVNIKAKKIGGPKVEFKQ